MIKICNPKYHASKNVLLSIRNHEGKIVLFNLFSSFSKLELTAVIPCLFPYLRGPNTAHEI